MKLKQPNPVRNYEIGHCTVESGEVDIYIEHCANIGRILAAVKTTYLAHDRIEIYCELTGAELEPD